MHMYEIIISILIFDVEQNLVGIDARISTVVLLPLRNM